MSTISLCLAVLAATADVRDGTVLVLENSNRIVELYTRSEVTHVALILRHGGQPWVYEATPDVVRRTSLASYYRELSEFNCGRRAANQLRVRLYQPAPAYTDQQVAGMRSYLEGELGRRYSVKGLVRDRPAAGVHCAELVTGALRRTGRQQFGPAHSLSPSVLVGSITSHHDAPLDVPLPAVEPAGKWCERTWNWWSGFFGWCGWACAETWFFCR
jgi:hypothetical protein